MRALATKLIAQQDASITAILTELEDAEHWGPDAQLQLRAEHRVEIGLMARELMSIECEADERLRSETHELRARHANQMHRAYREQAILGAALAAEEDAGAELIDKYKILYAQLEESGGLRAAAAELGERAQTLKAQMEARDGLRAELRKRMTEKARALERIGELSQQLEMAEAKAASWRGTAERREMQLRAAGEREGELVAEIRRRAATEAEFNQRLADLKTRTDIERNELKDTVRHLQEQNSVLRGRLVTFHATIHGMRDRGELPEQ